MIVVIDTLQKESLFRQAERTFGETSRSCAIAELLALLKKEGKNRNEGCDLVKIGKSLVGSTGTLLALLGVQAKADFLAMNYLHPSNRVIERKLEQIHQSVQTVLSFSRNLKDELANLRDKEQAAGEPILTSPYQLLSKAATTAVLPSTIQIHLDIEDDIANVRVIPDLVTDILSNLIDNAIQAMPHGGTITLRARNAGRHVALDVIDTGVGIAKDKLAHIFDLFFSTKRSSGFGLWSARRNALKNHGDLKVESNVGQGTTFTLLLPKTNGKMQ